MSSPAAQTARRYILTASVAAITATGAWYGAGLKTRQEFAQEAATIQQATPEEKIEQLEAVKAKYLARRAEMQDKIDRLQIEAKSAPSPR
ncbi:hypothetical protein BDY17DRAFT_327593 [Neohortaea acidophila]|uniref:Uncharacterized protein n=1 Tax=Neohortaea acidophila TaxID=245834 RepID=A0A6A6PIM8_9PEZI|nr:uncharacterized protein BDY17DRAFT_327593 [Neohortaea acidophila]KAF2479646.1 hypothetical protein BDY17DRAFT_327593 [Neohortaea acidophila]